MQEHGLLREVAEMHRAGPPRQTMLRREHRAEALRKQGSQLQAAPLHRRVEKGDVGALVSQRLHHLLRRGVHELELHSRRLAVQTAEQRGQDREHRLRAIPNRNAARGSGARLLQFPQQLAARREQRLGAARQPPTRRRQSHAARPSLEQRLAQTRLEHADLGAERRLGHAEPARRLAKAERLGHRREGREVPQLDTPAIKFGYHLVTSHDKTRTRKRVRFLAMKHLLPLVSLLVALVGPARADDLAPLNTRFDQPSALEGWSRLTVPGWVEKWNRAEIQSGRLLIQPGSGGWFEDMMGGHLYRPVTGDFVVTTRLRVRGTTTPLPRSSFSLAGLLVRAPREFNAGNWQPNQENWLFFSLGTAADPEALPAAIRVKDTPQFEIKSTYRSRSTLKISDAPSNHLDLRIVRDGSIFTLLYRSTEPDAKWTVRDQFIRSDLPGTLWVGLTAYSDWDSAAPLYPDYLRINRDGPPTSAADLFAEFESVSFRRPQFRLGLPIATLVSGRMADYTKD
jgi:hypothetical protein